MRHNAYGKIYQTNSPNFNIETWLLKSQMKVKKNNCLPANLNGRRFDFNARKNVAMDIQKLLYKKHENQFYPFLFSAITFYS